MGGQKGGFVWWTNNINVTITRGFKHCSFLVLPINGTLHKQIWIVVQSENETAIGIDKLEAIVVINGLDCLDVSSAIVNIYWLESPPR